MATPSEVEKLGEWVIASFTEGVLNGAINGDERLAVSMIRLAKMGIREYNPTLDEIKDASSPHYESADLWFNWTLIQAGGLSTEFKREIRIGLPVDPSYTCRFYGSCVTPEGRSQTSDWSKR